MVAIGGQHGFAVRLHAVPQSPWCSETLAMLGSDNVGNPAVFEQLLGRKGVHFSQLVATAWR